MVYEKDKLVLFHAFNSIYSADGQKLSQAMANSTHSILATDVKMESIPFAANLATAKSNASGSSIIKYNELVTLTQIPSSNGYAFYYAGNPDGTGTGYVDKWISPLDSLNGFAKSPGYTVLLYTSSGTEVKATDGTWYCNYNNGVIMLDPTNKPSVISAINEKLVLKASFFNYIGKTLKNTEFAPTWGTINNK